MARLRTAFDGLDLERREGIAISVLVAAGVLLRIVATVKFKHSPLLGDEPEYHATGIFFTQGHPFWGLAPLGTPHASLWKPPLYGAWVGVLYDIFGKNPFRVELIQAVVGSATIVLTWLIARRLFGRGVALAAAAVVTVYPLAWQWGAELYPEAIAVPLVLLVVWAFLSREPTPRLAAGVGALIGINLLFRPTSVYLFAGVLVAFLIAAGARRGLVLTAITIALAAVVVAPWTIRNAVVADAFVPISVQDAGIYGTFNSYSAADKEFPYAWRAYTPLTARFLKARPRPDEVELRRQLYKDALNYIGDHPASVPKAFFWNGLSRTWDVRRPKHAFDEAKFDGRNTKLNKIGLVMYWILLPLALIALVRLWRRRDVAWPVAALALGASVVFTVAAATRYRAPLEPVIVILACALFTGPLEKLGERLLGPRPASEHG